MTPTSLLVVLAAALTPAPGSAQTPVPALRFDELPSDSDLARILWERSPEFAQARGRIGTAQAERIRAGLYPNPELDLSVDSIAIGKRNPPFLSPFDQTAAYGVALSQPIEIAKRGPRKAAAEAALSSAALSVLGDLRERTYDLLERASEVATSEVRVAELERLRADAGRLTEIQRQRAAHGDAAGLDVDRAALDEAQLDSQLGDERAHLSEALASCTTTAGIVCHPFGSEDAARAFLSSRLSRPPPPEAILGRPDIRALDAQARSARAALTLARRRWIPDPTLRFGYTRDTLTFAGNQPNTLGVGLSIPLPFFDHGQGDDREAKARLEAAEQTREARVVQARREAASLLKRREQVDARRNRLHDVTLPLARSLVERMESALKAGGVALGDLLLARRTYGQLLLDAADLDLSAFRIAVGLERAMDPGPLPPPGLRDRAPSAFQESSS